MTPTYLIDILKRTASGDKDAFRELFMGFYPKIKYFITHIVKSDIVAEDLSQDIFERIWINRESLPDISFFSAYLYKMAKNRALNYLERERVERNYLSKYKMPRGVTIDEEFEVKELELLIQLAIENMPDQRKRIFQMSRNEHLKSADIAEKLNLSIRTVEKHLSLAIRDIKGAILVLLILFI